MRQAPIDATRVGGRVERSDGMDRGQSTMLISTRTLVRGAPTVAVLALSAAVLAACAAPQSNSMVNKKRSKEYFAESVYGVKASPRVTNKRTNLPRGGGRDQLGKPYKVRDKWYYPKEDPNYRKVGNASWYGDAFHGRLTANGEIYDATHLTAAHPTMPLPSYARVTNVENGSSIIVRVNDRGPYERGRIIDLSRRAAELLDYTRSGTAKVEVEYIGRAPLHGRDEQFLMASYRPSGTDPSDGLASGVMIAMNGPTPNSGLPAAVSLPGSLANAAPAPIPAAAVASILPADFVLPSVVPIAPERPALLPQEIQVSLATMSYAGTQESGAAAAFAALDGQTVPGKADVASWKHAGSAAAGRSAEPFVAAGSFDSKDEALQVADALSAFGRTEVEVSSDAGATWYSVNIYSDGSRTVDDLLQAAWSHGAPDAITVRD